MIIDAHYHFVPELESVERLLSEMQRCGIDRVILIPSLSEPFKLGWIAEKLGALMRRFLTKGPRSAGTFMYSTTVTSDGKFSVLGRTYRIFDKPDNDSVEKVIIKHPDRFAGWIAVNPSGGMGIEEVEKRLSKRYWVGVKAHPFWHRYPVRMLDDVARLCSEKEMPLLIHLGATGEQGDFKYLPERHPSLKIIYAHAGVPFYRELWDYAKRKERVYIDLSSPYLDFNLRCEALHFLGASKCIYGSDGPFGYYDKNGHYDHSAIIEEIKKCVSREDELNMIFYKNFMEIARGESLK